jgi:RNA polymerase sigma factor (sigma-70 family)
MPDKDQTDEELMTLYLSGESRAFEVLYFRYGPKVRSFLLKRQVLPQEADELQQLVFLKFHTSRHSYDKQYLVAQWVFVISKSVLNDYFRKKKRQVLEDGDLSDDKIDRLNQEFVSSHRDQEALTIPDLSRLSKEQQR